MGSLATEKLLGNWSNPTKKQNKQTKKYGSIPPPAKVKEKIYSSTPMTP